MKRPTAFLLCLCLAAALLSGCGGSAIGHYQGPEETAAAPEATEAPAADADAAPEGEDAAPETGLGFAAYAPDAVVARYNGSPVSWMEYFYWLDYNVGYLDYLAAMGALTYSDGWDGHDASSQYTDGEAVQQIAWTSLAEYRAAEELAAAEGVTVDEEAVRAYYEQSADSDGDGACSEEEAADFEAYLAGMNTDRAFFDDMTRRGMLSDALFEALYGADAADYPDDYAVEFADDQGIMAAKHILLLTTDMATGEALDEDVIAEKEQTAQDLYDQLAAVQDDPEALEALFDQLMEEHSEDTGLAANPDGYVFTEGVMVTAFEDAVRALEEYGLSEPVLSDYGYHIILRIPVDPDGTVMDPTGQGLTVRRSAAQADFSGRITAAMDAAQVEWEDGFQDLDMTAIFGER